MSDSEFQRTYGMTKQQYMNFFGALPPEPPPPGLGKAYFVSPYNTQQLASYDQARALVTFLNSTLISFPKGDPRPMGGGVLPGDDEVVIDTNNISNTPNMPQSPALPGIFIPTWGPTGNGPGATGPDGVKYFNLCLRFANGKIGMNVGLMLDKASRYPLSPSYVVLALASEAESPN